MRQEDKGTIAAPGFHRSPRSLAAWASFFVGATAATQFYMFRFARALIDDTFITLQYVLNLRNFGHWGFYPDRVTNTATSPLNVLATTVSSFLVADILRAALWLATVEAIILLGMLLLLSKKLFRRYYFGAASFLAIMANPLLISTLGLESLLYTTLFVACIYLFVVERWYLLAAVLALLTLTRPDGFLLFAILLMFCGSKRASNRTLDPEGGKIKPRLVSLMRVRLLFCLVYLLCLTPWYLFSWIHLGSLLPDTYFIKVNQSSWGPWWFANGLLHYMERFRLATIFSFFWLPFAPLLLVVKTHKFGRVALVLVGFGVLYFIGYSAIRVPPYHWYFAPIVVTTILLGLGAVSVLFDKLPVRRSLVARLLFCAVPVASTIGMVVFFRQANTNTATEMPIHTNWATHDQYQEIGLWLQDNLHPASKIQLFGELGTPAFYSQRQLMNDFTCRYTTQEIVDRQLAKGGEMSRLFADVNFLWFEAGPPCTPYTHDLLMSMTPGAPLSVDGRVLKQWDISSQWVARGSIFLVAR